MLFIFYTLIYPNTTIYSISWRALISIHKKQPFHKKSVLKSAVLFDRLYVGEQAGGNIMKSFFSCFKKSMPVTQ